MKATRDLFAKWSLSTRRWLAKHWRWLRFLVSGLGFLTIVYVVMKLAPDLFSETEGLNAEAKAESRRGVRTTALALAGGALAVVGAYFTAKTYNLNREGQLTDRFTRASEQLGHESLDVRLGGIYALERIARDSKDDHPQVVEVLTAYVREHAPRQQVDAGAQESQAAAENADPPQETEAARLATDVQAVLTVLGRRTLAHEKDAPPALDLILTDLTRANLTRANLSGANLGGANLRGADLREAILLYADLSGAILHDANLSGARLIEADLTRADVSGADLSEAHLSGADLTGADLTRADLRAAFLIRAFLTGADLTRADLTWARLMRADLSGAILPDADLREALLLGANLRRANLSEADLNGADLSVANLGKADLVRADLSGAVLSGADLREALHDRETTWPEGFDAKAAGAQMTEGD